MNLSDRDRRALEVESAYFELKCLSGCRYRRGLNVRRGDPRKHKNWKYFAAVADLCDGLGITVREYMRCVMWRTVDEQHRNWEVLPSMLPTKWAIGRWKNFRHQLPPDDTQAVRTTQMLGVLQSSRDFLRTRARILFDDPDVPISQLLRYRRPGCDNPEALRWILSGSLARAYLALSAAFWGWVETVPDYLRDEYVEVDEVKKMLGQLMADRELIERAREVMGDDFIKGI